ncbi:MAG TPA: SxtJ family membrane protein [Gemmatimonadaceae bacterium]|jgi:hypothetical protein|nr:SxtJ family membrane protein [Gemmatimonadaceae bacterium]
MLDPVIPPPNREPSARQFGLTIAVVLVAFALWPVARHGSIRVWPLAAAALLVAVSLAAPGWLDQPNHLVALVGRAIQRVVGPIVLATAYFVILTPTAMIMRWRGLDVLRRRRDPSARTYWIERPSRVIDRASLGRPY